jgi:hypothetical protein
MKSKSLNHLPNFCKPLLSGEPLPLVSEQFCSKCGSSLTDKQEIISADGHAIDGDDMHWTVSCPTCDREIEYTGYFDSFDINKCKCGTEFKTRRVYFDDKSYME